MSLPIPSQERVLVVDDDADSRGLVVFALRRAGFDVAQAADGMAALDLIRTTRIDLVVLDIAMPGMSGTEVVKELRTRPETSTLPILLMTGSGSDQSVIEGLGAGADDFLPKPVRLDELVARVTAHLRKEALWSHVVEDELRARAGVVSALSQLTLSTVPEEAAEAVVSELVRRTEADYIGVLQLRPGGRLLELATFDRAQGVQRGGHALAPAVARDVIKRARDGPWVEEVAPLAPGERTASFALAAPELAVGAPIYAGEKLVGLLTLGSSRDPGGPHRGGRAQLLAAAIDYARVLSVVAGSSFADQRDVAALETRLRRVLKAGQFHPVYQPIVELKTRAIVGYEALTRFDDGTLPNVRFAEAAVHGLGLDYELITDHAAIDGARALPSDAFLSLNVSPEFVLSGDRRFRELIKGAGREVVLELTEHVPVTDYAAVKDAIAELGAANIAVDDAGAGYASLRHILELRPAYAKLDMSLVRGIDADDLRLALAAGLQYFAARTGCRLIAEGVESEGEANALRSLGVELGQGFLFGRPEPAADPRD
jgi:EAL domain-containing protein (putative c-di-GMP-specific phosphodiesterase class I)/DNA-binding response OmpR family regulator